MTTAETKPAGSRSTRWVAAWTAAVLGTAPAGCAPDQCADGARFCRGNVAESCVGVSDTELTGHNEWRREDCGTRFCAVPPEGESGGAFCALSPAQDPSCPAALRTRPDASACVGDNAVRWSHGWRVGETLCAAGTTCIDEWSDVAPGCDAEAFCAVGSAPDPLCGSGIGTACADETTIVHCRCGFRADAHACRDPGPSCVLESPGGAMQGVCR